MGSLKVHEIIGLQQDRNDALVRADAWKTKAKELKRERDQLKQRLEALESDFNVRENALNSRVDKLEAAADGRDEQIVSLH